MLLLMLLLRLLLLTLLTTLLTTLLLHLGHHLGHHSLLGFGIGGGSALHLLHLLHVLHVLLPPLSHGLGSHSSVGVLGGGSGRGIRSGTVTSMASVTSMTTLVVATIVIVTMVTSSMGTGNSIGHSRSSSSLGSVFGSLDLNGLILENQKRLGKNGVHGLFRVKSHKTKSSRTSRVLVNHKLSVNNGSILLKELFVVFFSDIGADSTDKNLTGLILLFSGDSSLWINDLSIKVMFLGHDSIDTLGVSEGEKSKASRLAREMVSHHSTFQHLSKLRKVVCQRLVCGFPVETSNEHFALVLGRNDNVAQSGVSVRSVDQIAVRTRHRSSHSSSHLRRDGGG